MTPLELKRLINRMARQIHKLHIGPGDIIVVKDLETMGALAAFPLPGVPQCAFLYAPQGLEKASLDSLISIVDQATKLKAAAGTVLVPKEEAPDATIPTN